MNVVTTAQVDELMMNMELAKAMSETPDQLHLIKGSLGYRVRVQTPWGWRMVNYKNPKLVANLEETLGLQVDETDGVFRATLPGARASAKADTRSLAVALAACKAPIQQGVLQVVL